MPGRKRAGVLPEPGCHEFQADGRVGAFFHELHHFIGLCADTLAVNAQEHFHDGYGRTPVGGMKGFCFKNAIQQDGGFFIQAGVNFLSFFDSSRFL